MRELPDRVQTSVSEIDSRRRRFLTRALAGSVGVAIIAGLASESAGAEVYSVCGVRDSAADAIDAYLGTLSKIQTEVQLGIIRKVQKSLGTCSDMLSQLQERLKRLDAALNKPPQGNSANNPERREQVEQLRGLIQVSSAHVSLIAASPGASAGGQNVRSLISTLAVIQTQAGQTVTNLLPADPSKLTPEVIGILNEILNLIKESAKLKEDIDKSQQETNIEINTLGKDIDKIEASLLMAKVNALTVEDPFHNGNKAQAKAEATANLNSALDKLEELRADSRTTKDGSQHIDVLSLLLEGTRLWIENFNNPANSGRKDAQSLPAGSSRNHAAAQPKTFDEEVSEKFWNYCQPGSSYRVSFFKSLVLNQIDNIVAGNAAIGRIANILNRLLGRPVTSSMSKEDITFLIAAALDYWGVTCQPIDSEHNPNYRPDRQKLASELAAYIKGRHA
ncbi:MAG: hypothetical protein JO360_07595 [Acidobacteria bacterium]|nr:hypothetical protein [Acidobacteriota bacterium]